MRVILGRGNTGKESALFVLDLPIMASLMLRPIHPFTHRAEQGFLDLHQGSRAGQT